jgi:hypothetical protein
MKDIISGKYTKISSKNVKEIDHLGDLGLDGRITLKESLHKFGARVRDWIHLAQERVLCRIVEKTIMNIWVP